MKRRSRRRGRAGPATPALPVPIEPVEEPPEDPIKSSVELPPVRPQWSRNPWDVFIQPDEEPFEDPSAASGRSTPTPTWPLFLGAMISQGRREPGRDILHAETHQIFPRAEIARPS